MTADPTSPLDAAFARLEAVVLALQAENQRLHAALHQLDAGLERALHEVEELIA